MDIPNATPTNNTSSRRALLLTFAIFLLPVLIAYLLLKTGWYTSAGTSNRGLLINPPISFDDLALTGSEQKPLEPELFRKKWWIMYVIPATCDGACRNSLYLMRQAREALGPESSRVAELIVTTHTLNTELAEWIALEFPQAVVASANVANVDSTLQQAFADKLSGSNAGHLFLVDTMGAIFMHYPSFSDEQESILKGRDLLKDLQKVLKLSKIG